MKNFGLGYLQEENRTIEELLEEMKKQSDWDLEAKDVIVWLEKIRKTYFPNSIKFITETLQ